MSGAHPLELGSDSFEHRRNVSFVYTYGSSVRRFAVAVDFRECLGGAEEIIFLLRHLAPVRWPAQKGP